MVRLWCLLQLLLLSLTRLPHCSSLLIYGPVDNQIFTFRPYNLFIEPVEQTGAAGFFYRKDGLNRVALAENRQIQSMNQQQYQPIVY